MYREKVYGSHTVTGTQERQAWLRRLLEGTITSNGRAVLSPDGIEYQLKKFLIGHCKPGEIVMFVPRDGVWKGQLWAAEVWRRKANGKLPKP